MKPGLSFCSLAGWIPRDQDPSDVADRWLRMIERLQILDPMFSQWYIANKNDKFSPLRLNSNDVSTAIVAGAGRDDDGSEDPRLAYRFNTYNCPGPIKGPRDFQITTCAGPNAKYGNNFVSLYIPYGVVPDPSLVTFDIFRGVILAQSEAFEATTAYAWQAKLGDFWPKGNACPRLPLSWISYIGPGYVHLVTPPSSAVVEHRPDGGLLMAATKETFDVDNPTHMAVARDIAAAVAPFNALPRPLGDRTYDPNGWPIRG